MVWVSVMIPPLESSLFMILLTCKQIKEYAMYWQKAEARVWDTLHIYWSPLPTLGGYSRTMRLTGWLSFLSQICIFQYMHITHWGAYPPFPRWAILSECSRLRTCRQKESPDLRDQAFYIPHGQRLPESLWLNSWQLLLQEFVSHIFSGLSWGPVCRTSNPEWLGIPVHCRGW